MKKFAMLMLVCVMAVSAGAATYQVADYLDDPTLDMPITGNWDDHPWGSGAWIIDYPSEYVYEHSTDWAAAGPNPAWNYKMSYYVDMQADAYTGTQAVAFVGQQDFGWIGINAVPDETLNAGDTWELDFALKAYADPALAPGDVYVRIWANGGIYNTMIIPGSEITQDWVEYSYSEVYNGPDGVWAGGWSIEILMDTPPAAQWGGVYVDLVPEPATMSLLGIGGVLGLIRRKK